MGYKDTWYRAKVIRYNERDGKYTIEYYADNKWSAVLANKIRNVCAKEVNHKYQAPGTRYTSDLEKAQTQRKSAERGDAVVRSRDSRGSDSSATRILCDMFKNDDDMNTELLKGLMEDVRAAESNRRLADVPDLDDTFTSSVPYFALFGFLAVIMALLCVFKARFAAKPRKEVYRSSTDRMNFEYEADLYA